MGSTVREQVDYHGSVTCQWIRFGYWRREGTYSKNLGQFVRRMNNHTLRNYLNLLPSLGQRAVPILLESLTEITSDSAHRYKATLIGQALAKVAEQEGTELEGTITKLLNTSSQLQQTVAITILQATPTSRHLDRLWELHRQRRDAMAKDRDRTRDYQVSLAALRAGTELDPSWIRNKILTGKRRGSTFVNLLICWVD